MANNNNNQEAWNLTAAMQETPKHFVFLACLPGTVLSGNSAATLLEAVIQPEDPSTFLCHWINRSALEAVDGTNRCSTVTTFRDCPKLVMLISPAEILRLGDWCIRSLPQEEACFTYSPKIPCQFYAYVRDVSTMYNGMCQISHNPQKDLYWWAPPALGLPFTLGVHWTESDCVFSYEHQGSQVASGNGKWYITRVHSFGPALPDEDAEERYILMMQLRSSDDIMLGPDARLHMIIADFFVEDMMVEIDVPIVFKWPQMPYPMAPKSYTPSQPGFRVDLTPTSEKASVVEHRV
ncbi:hypothetical protein QIS74_08071 [Colletotrichum tabaci]|uniref:Uncharacterized protein n=1 Tax=Colletotrichum tabaci TaxID=1209068 RepID=A0AAV9T704_9PEZI